MADQIFVYGHYQNYFEINAQPRLVSQKTNAPE